MKDPSAVVKAVDESASSSHPTPAPDAARPASTGIWSRLGFGSQRAHPYPAKPGDVSTQLANVRTDLAADRTYLAAERTLMAWIRTALSMISFGFTLGKLGQVLHEVETKGLLGKTRTVSVKTLAYLLVVLGTAALCGALVQHRKRLRGLRAMGLPVQVSITFVVGLLLCIIGAFALTSLTAAL